MWEYKSGRRLQHLTLWEANSWIFGVFLVQESKVDLKSDVKAAYWVLLRFWSDRFRSLWSEIFELSSDRGLECSFELEKGLLVLCFLYRLYVSWMCFRKLQWCTCRMRKAWHIHSLKVLTQQFEIVLKAFWDWWKQRKWYRCCFIDKKMQLNVC